MLHLSKSDSVLRLFHNVVLRATGTGGRGLSWTKPSFFGHEPAAKNE